MATYARSIQTGKLSIGMTALTGYARVTAGQWELRAVVIEIYVIPARGIMTGRTILPKLTFATSLLKKARKSIR